MVDKWRKSSGKHPPSCVCSNHQYLNLRLLHCVPLQQCFIVIDSIVRLQLTAIRSFLHRCQLNQVFRRRLFFFGALDSSQWRGLWNSWARHPRDSLFKYHNDDLLKSSRRCFSWRIGALCCKPYWTINGMHRNDNNLLEIGCIEMIKENIYC